MAKNIKLIYDTCQRISNDVCAKKDADPNYKLDKQTMNTLTEAFNDIIDFEKMHLITQHNTFYGSFLMELGTKIDFTLDGAVSVDISKDPFVLVVNPIRCAQYRYSEFSGIVCSEITRIAVGHPLAYADANSEKDDEKHNILDAASDASVSEMIKDDIRRDSTDSIRLPNDACTVSKLNNILGVSPKREDSLEYYYNVIRKFAQSNGNGGKFGNISTMGSGAGSAKAKSKNSQDGDSDGDNSSGHGNSSKPNDGEFSSPGHDTGNKTHDWEGGDEADKEERIKAFVSNVLSKMSDRQKGDIPGGIMSEIEKLIAPPEINWKQILRRLVGSIPVPYRKTRRRLNRRQPFRPDLCGKLPKRIVSVVCVFDTSGSMSDSDLSYCMNEVFNIAKCYEGAKITIIECDVEVNRVYEAKNINELKTKMSGRGGTSFIPAIEFINGDDKYKDNPLSGKFRNSLMVYFTDGYGDSEIPKPKTFRNLWVVLNDVNNLSLSEPYGEVKSLSMDKDYMKLKNKRGY